MDHKKTIDNKFFLNLDRELKNAGSTYISLLVFDKNSNVINSKSNNSEWVHEFTSSGLYKNCHLLKTAHEKILTEQSSSFCLAWDFCTAITEKEKALEEIRKAKDICHGVGFILKVEELTLMLNVAGKYSDINFGYNILKHRSDIYRSLRDFFIKKPSV